MQIIVPYIWLINHTFLLINTNRISVFKNQNFHSSQADLRIKLNTRKNDFWFSKLKKLNNSDKVSRTRGEEKSGEEKRKKNSEGKKKI